MSALLVSLFWIGILGFWSILASFAFETSIMYLVLTTLRESLFVHNQVFISLRSSLIKSFKVWRSQFEALKPVSSPYNPGLLFFTTNGRSFTYIRNSNGPRHDPLGMPQVTILTPNFTYRVGRGYSYIIEDMDVRQGISNSYPLQTKIGPFADNSKIYTLKRRKMNF